MLMLLEWVPKQIDGMLIRNKFSKAHAVEFVDMPGVIFWVWRERGPEILIYKEFFNLATAEEVAQFLANKTKQEIQLVWVGSTQPYITKKPQGAAP